MFSGFTFKIFNVESVRFFKYVSVLILKVKNLKPKNLGLMIWLAKSAQ